MAVYSPPFATVMGSMVGNPGNLTTLATLVCLGVICWDRRRTLVFIRSLKLAGSPSLHLTLGCLIPFACLGTLYSGLGDGIQQ
ncbi:hypothetical protein F4803DRAFT_503149 [Xylaria telfairii]|nr:hypothetical protein F4803DRAFT_503149 [Xylaria telfairii]